MLRTAINGFGRIGRLSFRAWHEKYQEQMDIVAINTSGSMTASSWAHLLKYDTIYGKFSTKIESEDLQDPSKTTDQNSKIGIIKVDGKEFPIYAQRDPEKLPWKDLNVDVVIESTGVFRDEEGAKKHLTAGAKKVVLSSPSKGGRIGTYVLGANKYSGEGEIISNASCTTNCVAPIAAILHAKFGILKAVMTTVHGYTSDQRLQDNSHKDLRRSRAAALNMIPTTTGAAAATTETIPELKGLFDGIAVRVPVAVGSLVDMVCLVKERVTIEKVNLAFKDAAENKLWSGIIAVNEEPIVSSDIVGRSESAIVDLPFTRVVDGDLVKVLAWYDNELGYGYRLIEQTIEVGKTL